MLRIGDLAVHQQTGEFGKVIGYGHEMLNNVYQTTLKVLITNLKGSDKSSLIKEDLCSAWTQMKMS